MPSSTTSAKRKAASQANAKLSTGPRTEAGKQRSSQNARTHGLTARRCTVLPGEEADFATVHDNLSRELAPDGDLEAELFAQLLTALWTLRRAHLLENRLLLHSDGDPASADPHKFHLYETYIRRLERTQSSTLTQLRKLQTEREYRRRTLAEDPADVTSPAAIAQSSRLTEMAAAARQHRRDQLTPWQVLKAEVEFRDLYLRRSALAEMQFLVDNPAARPTGVRTEETNPEGIIQDPETGIWEYAPIVK